MVAPGREPHELPRAGQIGRQLAERNILDQDAEQALAEAVGEIKLLEAPARGKPRLRDEEEDHLAPACRLIERALPPLARDDAAFGIEIEEKIIPTLADQPIAQRNRFHVVRARMAQENASQGNLPPVTPERLRIVTDARDKCSRFAAATSSAEPAGKSEVQAFHGWRHPSRKATSELSPLRRMISFSSV